MGQIFTFEELPKTLEELKALPNADLKSPEGTVALTIAALTAYPENKDACIEMLNYLKGPQPLSPREVQFLRDRFMDKNYIAKSYFKGAKPENNYEPNRPYQVEVLETPHTKDQLSEGYLVYYLQSGGADSPRSITVRNKPSTGEWFFWDQMLLGGIRIPQNEDPWA